MIGDLCDEALDGDLEFDDAAEDTALQSSLGEFGEEAFDGIEPRAPTRREAMLAVMRYCSDPDFSTIR